MDATPPRPHPSTGEPLYTDEEREFLRAVQDYKTRTRRMFPSWREVLAIVKSLGYRKGGQ